MKNILTLIITLLISFVTFAQQGINYKALIKDDLGSVVTNQEVTIRFTIFNMTPTSNENIIYQGTHNNVMTDANGILIVNIGEGTQSLSYDSFNNINWRAVNYLTVEIDITGGTNFIDIGTTQFTAVPYAKHVLTAGNIPSGLDIVSEGSCGFSATGWRLKRSDPNDHGYIGVLAIDLSIQGEVSESRGATGHYSIASGYETTASGNYSSVMGIRTKAESYASLAIGRYNIGGGSDNDWSGSHPLFEIGNGTSDSERNNALTIYKNGNAEFDGEIQQASTGNANMIPLAYGTVDSNGDIETGTGNFTAFLSGNVFVIDVNDTSLSYGNTVCLITSISTAARTSSTIITDGNGDGDADLNVYIFNTSGTQVTTTFQFVIYKL